MFEVIEMGIGFRKSFKIAPGVRVNLGKKGIGVSAGVKGLRYSVNTSGQRRTTASIPGTGLNYTKTSSGSRNYKTSSYQRQRELERAQKQQEKMEELERNKLEVALFENKVEMLKSIHKEYDDQIDWLQVKNSLPPYSPGEHGARTKMAIIDFETYKPSFLDKLTKRVNNKIEKLKNAVESAKEEDHQEYLNWELLVNTATNVLSGNIDTYFEVINEFAPLDDLSEFGSGFEFFLEEPHWMEVEFDVQTKNVVPTTIKSLTKTGKLTIKDMPKTKYLDLQQDYVCSCTLRIARDLFALLPLETIYIHALDEQLNTSTGHHEKAVILSIKIDREDLMKLNFDAIDCSDSLSNFLHHMNFKKTKGFAPVEKINP